MPILKVDVVMTLYIDKINTRNEADWSTEYVFFYKMSEAFIFFQ